MSDNNPYAAPKSDGESGAKPYHVSCACGRRVAVQASQAGSAIVCQCGAKLDVPTLSRLRRSAGEDPIPLTTIDRIRTMIGKNELPDGKICCCCGRPATDVVWLRVQCERTWTTGEDSRSVRVLFALLFLGWIGTLIALRKSRPGEEFGRDVSVDVPISVSSECVFKILRMRRQRSLKRLLKTTPIYEQLLNEYPQAIVTPVTGDWK